MHKIRARAVLRRIEEGAKVAEVGVFAGKMSEALLKQKKMTLYMIDSWGTEHSEEYKATGDFHSQLTQQQQNRYMMIAEGITRGYNREIIRKDSAEAAKDFPDNYFDLVFIDADHSYEGCKRDIEAYLPKVKKGGYIGGHDYNNVSDKFEFGVTKAVDEFVKNGYELELDKNFTWFVCV